MPWARPATSRPRTPCLPAAPSGRRYRRRPRCARGLRRLGLGRTHARERLQGRSSDAERPTPPSVLSLHASSSSKDRCGDPPCNYTRRAAALISAPSRIVSDPPARARFSMASPIFSVVVIQPRRTRYSKRLDAPKWNDDARSKHEGGLEGHAQERASGEGGHHHRGAVNDSVVVARRNGLAPVPEMRREDPWAMP